MRLVKFDFDFGRVYKELKEEQIHRFNGFIYVGSYHYLSWDDFYHDSLSKTIVYINKNFEEDTISEYRFRAIYWKTSAFVRLTSVKSDLLKTQEKKNFEYISHISPESDSQDGSPIYLRMVNNNSVEQTDLDHVSIVKDIEENYPSLNKVLAGYSFTECAEEANITPRGFSKRYHKEIAKLIKTYHA